MRLLLARHGNTFEAGDKVVWVGARTDLPLTAKGEAQAVQLAQALQRLGVKPLHILAGPLRRTREHAAIIAKVLGIAPTAYPPSSCLPSPLTQTLFPGGEEADRGCSDSISKPLWGEDEQGEGRSLRVDERLKEIDYGLWEGKSSEEILRDFPKASLDAWNKHGIWPAGVNWMPSAEVITNNIAQLAAELVQASAPDDVSLLVTSNGILKFFLKLVPGAFEVMAEKEALKVGTGHVCMLSHRPFGWELGFWNLDPAQLARGWPG